MRTKALLLTSVLLFIVVTTLYFRPQVGHIFSKIENLTFGKQHSDGDDAIDQDYVSDQRLASLLIGIGEKVQKLLVRNIVSRGEIPLMKMNFSTTESSPSSTYNLGWAGSHSLAEIQPHIPDLKLTITLGNKIANSEDSLQDLTLIVSGIPESICKEINSSAFREPLSAMNASVNLAPHPALPNDKSTIDFSGSKYGCFEDKSENHFIYILLKDYQPQM